jgi:hypothetical protein
VPNGVGLGVTVQEQEWRAMAFDAGVDLHIAQVKPEGGEIRKKWWRVHERWRQIHPPHFNG